MNPGSRLRSSLAIPASQSRILPSQPGSRVALSQHLPLHKRPTSMAAADKRPATVSVAQPRSPAAPPPAARPYSLTSHMTHRAALTSPQTHSFPRSDQIQTHPRIPQTRPPSTPSPVAALTRGDASGPRPHPTALWPGSAPKAQAPPPGQDSEPPAGVSLARTLDAHAQSFWPAFPALRPHTATFRGSAAVASVFLARCSVRARSADRGERARRDKE